MHVVGAATTLRPQNLLDRHISHVQDEFGLAPTLEPIADDGE
jgi:hypothetical protein